MMKGKGIIWQLAACSLLLFCSLASAASKTITPVDNFQLPQYLGRWYEIARLDHTFEKGLENVTAEYSMQPDGKVRVVNRGYNPQTEEWNTAVGKAKLAGPATTGKLKVSFFGPLYGDYIVLDTDPDHDKYSLVSGPNRRYLWILSRTPTLDSATLKKLVEEARQKGYPVKDLTYVKQSWPKPADTRLPAQP